jgi:type I restriction enzyme S subunit
MTKAPSMVALGEVADFIRGINFKPDDVVTLDTPGSVACMRTKNVQTEIDLTDVWAVADAFVRREEQMLQCGDILVSSANSWNLVGKCCWIPQLPYRASFGGFISVLRGKNGKVFNRYLYHWFASGKIQALLRSFGQKTTNISNLNFDRCLKLQIPLPPLAEQKRIAEVLDKAEELRAKRRAALAQLDTLTQSIFLEMFGDPMANEKNWPLLAVGKAGLVQLGRQRAPKYQSGKHTRKYVRVANIYENRIDLSDVLSMDFDSKDFALYRLQHGDILLNEGQSTELVGRVAMWRNEISDCCFQNTLVRFQPHRKTTTPEFALAVFLHYYRSGEFAKISSKTSNVAHLGAGRFAAMPFPLPPLPMQEEFARRFKLVEKLKATQRASLAELDTLFASLQQRAFTGEL